MLSNAALLCLESNIFLRWELFNRGSVTNTPQERKQNSEYYKLKKHLRSNPSAFFDYFNMSIEVYDYIFQNVKERLDAAVITIKTLSSGEKLFITLRYLAKGLTLKEVSQAFLIGCSTASKLINDTLDAIWESLHTTHMDPSQVGKADAKKLAREYFHKWRFPNCVGAIGGKYIAVHRSKKKKSKVWRMRRYDKNALILYAVTDANFRFLAIQVLEGPKAPDYSFGGVFLNMGMDYPPNSDTKLPLVMIGNQAFSLKTNLLRPFPSRAVQICERKAKFNKRLESARVTVDCAFEILSEKWQIYKRPLVHVEFAIMTIKTTCLLHNIIRDIDGLRDPLFYKFGLEDRGVIYLDLLTRHSRKSNRSSSVAVQIREQFEAYLLENE